MLKSRKLTALIVGLLMAVSLLSVPNIASAADDIVPTLPFKVPYTDMSPSLYNSLEGNNFNSEIVYANQQKEMKGIELRTTDGTPDGATPAGNAAYLKYTNGDVWMTNPYGEYNGFNFLVYTGGNRLPNCNPGELFVNEFDLKFDTNTDALLFYTAWIPFWGENKTVDEQYTLFDAEGKLKGTDYSYPVGEWFHFKMKYNQENGKFDVTVTDSEGDHNFKLARNAANPGWVPSGYGRMNFALYQVRQKATGEETAGVAFDNFKVYKEVAPSDGYIFSPSGSYKSLKDLKLSASVADADAVKFYIDDAEVKTFTAPGSGQYTYTETVDLSSLSAGTHSFKVVKVNGKLETKLSESLFSYTPYFESKITVISPSAWESPTGYKARVEEYQTDSDGNIRKEPDSMKYAWYPEDTYNFSDGNFLYRRLWSYGTRDNNNVVLNRKDVGRTGTENDYAGSLTFKNTITTDSDKDGFTMTYGTTNTNTALSRDGGIISFEFDILLGTTEDAFGLTLPLWHGKVAGEPAVSSTWIFGPDGKITGTEVPYSANQWMHLKMEYDFDNDLWNVWLANEGEPEQHVITDVHASTDTFGADYTKKWERAQYIINQRGTKTTDEAGAVVNPAHVRIDNYSQKRFEKLPSFSNVSYTEGGEQVLTASELQISDKSDKIILSLDRNIDEILESDISLTINGEEKDKTVAYDKANRKITLTLPSVPDGIKDGDKIGVTLLGTAKAHKVENNKILDDGSHETISISLGAPVSVTLNVVSSDVFVKNLNIDKAKAAVEVWNGSGKQIDNAVLVVAGFDGNRLASISYTSISEITTGSNKYNVDMTADCTGLSTKAFIWNANTDKFMQPLETN